MKFPLILFLICLSQFSFGQIKIDVGRTEPRPDLVNKTLLPASLILTGILLSDSMFEKDFQKDLRNAVGNNFGTSLDDYTRYAPIAQLYIADIAGAEAKNHWFDQTKNLVISAGLTQLLTSALKRHVYKVRPNNFNAESFPSGHTSNAFANASVLYEEFKDSHPLLAYSGYGFAATTGALRMMNNKHFLSDVLAGAGLGILVTKVVYHFDYLFAWNPFKNSKDIVVTPMYSGDSVGIYFAKRF